MTTKSKMVFVSPLTFKEHKGKEFKQKSKVVPDQIMPIRKMIQKHQRGEIVYANAKQPIYYGDDGEAIDFAKLDLADKEAFLDAAQEELKDIEKYFHDRENAVKIREKELAEEKERIKRMLEQQEQNQNINSNYERKHPIVDKNDLP